MLTAGSSAGLKHCAFKRDEDTSLGVEPGPKSQVLGSCQGLPLWRPGLCGSGLQPGTALALLPTSLCHTTQLWHR